MKILAVVHFPLVDLPVVAAAAAAAASVPASAAVVRTTVSVAILALAVPPAIAVFAAATHDQRTHLSLPTLVHEMPD